MCTVFICVQCLDVHSVYMCTVSWCAQCLDVLSVYMCTVSGCKQCWMCTVSRCVQCPDVLSACSEVQSVNQSVPKSQPCLKSSGTGLVGLIQGLHTGHKYHIFRPNVSNYLVFKDFESKHSHIVFKVWMFYWGTLKGFVTSAVQCTIRINDPWEGALGIYTFES